MKTEIIKTETMIHSKWSGGTTTQIYIKPNGLTVKDNFNYRISSATVLSGENTFSDFSKYNRFLVILNGEIKISHNDGEYKTLKSFEKYFFDGAAKTKSISECDIVDFNVIYKKDINNLKFEILIGNNSFEIETAHFFYNYNNNAEISIEDKKYILKEKELLIIENVIKKQKIETKGKIILGTLAE